MRGLAVFISDIRNCKFLIASHAIYAFLVVLTTSWQLDVRVTRIEGPLEVPKQPSVSPTSCLKTAASYQSQFGFLEEVKVAITRDALLKFGDSWSLPFGHQTTLTFLRGAFQNSVD